MVVPLLLFMSGLYMSVVVILVMWLDSVGSAEIAAVHIRLRHNNESVQWSVLVMWTERIAKDGNLDICHCWPIGSCLASGTCL